MKNKVGVNRKHPTLENRRGVSDKRRVCDRNNRQKTRHTAEEGGERQIDDIRDIRA